MPRAVSSLLFALAACGGSVSVSKAPPPPPAPATAVAPPPAPAPAGPAFMVATDCEPATRAAARVLADGGHAADAAIVAALVAGLAHPSSSGLGGGGFAIVFDAENKKAIGYDFRVTAPDPLPVGSPWALGGPAEARIGTPGELAGLTQLQRHATRPWKAQIDDALAVARGGLTVSPHLARAFDQHPGLARAFGLPTGQPISPGTPLKRPKLEALLQRLSDLDADVPASVAPAPARTVDVLRVQRGGLAVLTVPSAGGHVLWESLSLLPSTLPPAGEARHHLLAEVFGLANEDRMRHAGAGGRLPLSSAHLEARRALLDPKRHRPIPSAPHDEGGTTNIAIIDGEGNAVVWSSSLGHSFGAGVLTDDGVVPNDGLSLFARPAERRRFGDANAPRPGAAPTVSLAPTLVLRGEDVAFALGASGGEHVPTALVQVLLRLDSERPVDAPRLRTPVAGGLWLETDEAELAPGLRGRGHHVRSDLANHSGVVMVSAPPERARAFVDPRRGGATAVSPPPVDTD